MPQTLEHNGLQQQLFKQDLQVQFFSLAEFRSLVWAVEIRIQ